MLIEDNYGRILITPLLPSPAPKPPIRESAQRAKSTSRSDYEKATDHARDKTNDYQRAARNGAPKSELDKLRTGAIEAWQAAGVALLEHLRTVAVSAAKGEEQRAIADEIRRLRHDFEGSDLNTALHNDVLDNVGEVLKPESREIMEAEVRLDLAKDALDTASGLAQDVDGLHRRVWATEFPEYAKHTHEALEQAEANYAAALDNLFRLRLQDELETQFPNASGEYTPQQLRQAAAGVSNRYGNNLGVRLVLDSIVAEVVAGGSEAADLQTTVSVQLRIELGLEAPAGTDGAYTPEQWLAAAGRLKTRYADHEGISLFIDTVVQSNLRAAEINATYEQLRRDPKQFNLSEAEQALLADGRSLTLATLFAGGIRFVGPDEAASIDAGQPEGVEPPVVLTPEMADLAKTSPSAFTILLLSGEQAKAGNDAEERAVTRAHELVGPDANPRLNALLTGAALVAVQLASEDMAIRRVGPHVNDAEDLRALDTYMEQVYSQAAMQAIWDAAGAPYFGEDWARARIAGFGNDADALGLWMQGTFGNAPRQAADIFVGAVMETFPGRTFTTNDNLKSFFGGLTELVEQSPSRAPEVAAWLHNEAGPRVLIEMQNSDSAIFFNDSVVANVREGRGTALPLAFAEKNLSVRKNDSANALLTLVNHEANAHQASEEYRVFMQNEDARVTDYFDDFLNDGLITQEYSVDEIGGIRFQNAVGRALGLTPNINKERAAAGDASVAWYRTDSREWLIINSVILPLIRQESDEETKIRLTPYIYVSKRDGENYAGLISLKRGDGKELLIDGQAAISMVDTVLNKPSTGEEDKTIDPTKMVQNWKFDDFRDFQNENDYADSGFIYLPTGMRIADEDNDGHVDWGKRDAARWTAKDTAFLAADVGFTIAAVVSAPTPAAPIVIPAAMVYGGARLGYELYHMAEHGQTLDWSNPNARMIYLNAIFLGAGAASMGAGAAARLTLNSTRIVGGLANGLSPASKGMVFASKFPGGQMVYRGGVRALQGGVTWVAAMPGGAATYQAVALFSGGASAIWGGSQILAQVSYLVQNRHWMSMGEIGTSLTDITLGVIDIASGATGNRMAHPARAPEAPLQQSQNDVLATDADMLIDLSMVAGERHGETTSRDRDGDPPSVARHADDDHADRDTPGDPAAGVSHRHGSEQLAAISTPDVDVPILQPRDRGFTVRSTPQRDQLLETAREVREQQSILQVVSAFKSRFGPLLTMDPMQILKLIHVVSDEEFERVASNDYKNPKPSPALKAFTQWEGGWQTGQPVAIYMRRSPDGYLDGVRQRILWHELAHFFSALLFRLKMSEIGATKNEANGLIEGAAEIVSFRNSGPAAFRKLKDGYRQYLLTLGHDDQVNPPSEMGLFYRRSAVQVERMIEALGPDGEEIFYGAHFQHDWKAVTSFVRVAKQVLAEDLLNEQGAGRNGGSEILAQYGSSAPPKYVKILVRNPETGDVVEARLDRRHLPRVQHLIGDDGVLDSSHVVPSGQSALGGLPAAPAARNPASVPAPSMPIPRNAPVRDIQESLFGPDRDDTLIEGIRAAKASGQTSYFLLPRDLQARLIGALVSAWKNALSGTRNAHPGDASPSDAVLIEQMVKYFQDKRITMRQPRLEGGAAGGDPHPIRLYHTDEEVRTGQFRQADIEIFLDRFLSGAHFVVGGAPTARGRMRTHFYDMFRNSPLRDHTGGKVGHSHYPIAGTIGIGRSYPNTITSDHAPDPSSIVAAVLVGHKSRSEDFFQLESWPATEWAGLRGRHRAGFKAHQETGWNISLYGASPYSEKRGQGPHGHAILLTPERAAGGALPAASSALDVPGYELAADGTGSFSLAPVAGEAPSRGRKRGKPVDPLARFKDAPHADRLSQIAFATGDEIDAILRQPDIDAIVSRHGDGTRREIFSAIMRRSDRLNRMPDRDGAFYADLAAFVDRDPSLRFRRLNVLREGSSGIRASGGRGAFGPVLAGNYREAAPIMEALQGGELKLADHRELGQISIAWGSVSGAHNGHARNGNGLVRVREHRPEALKILDQLVANAKVRDRTPKSATLESGGYTIHLLNKTGFQDHDGSWTVTTIKRGRKAPNAAGERVWRSLRDEPAALVAHRDAPFRPGMLGREPSPADIEPVVHRRAEKLWQDSGRKGVIDDFRAIAERDARANFFIKFLRVEGPDSVIVRVRELDPDRGRKTGWREQRLQVEYGGGDGLRYDPGINRTTIFDIEAGERRPLDPGRQIALYDESANVTYLIDLANAKAWHFGSGDNRIARPALDTTYKNVEASTPSRIARLGKKWLHWRIDRKGSAADPVLDVYRTLTGNPDAELPGTPDFANRQVVQLTDLFPEFYKYFNDIMALARGGDRRDESELMRLISRAGEFAEIFVTAMGPTFGTGDGGSPNTRRAKFNRALRIDSKNINEFIKVRDDFFRWANLMRALSRVDHDLAVKLDEAVRRGPHKGELREILKAEITDARFIRRVVRAGESHPYRALKAHLSIAGGDPRLPKTAEKVLFRNLRHPQEISGVGPMILQDDVVTPLLQQAKQAFDFRNEKHLTSMRRLLAVQSATGKTILIRSDWGGVRENEVGMPQPSWIRNYDNFDATIALIAPFAQDQTSGVILSIGVNRYGKPDATPVPAKADELKDYGAALPKHIAYMEEAMRRAPGVSFELTSEIADFNNKPSLRDALVTFAKRHPDTLIFGSNAVKPENLAQYLRTHFEGLHFMAMLGTSGPQGAALVTKVFRTNMTDLTDRAVAMPLDANRLANIVAALDRFATQLNDQGLKEIAFKARAFRPRRNRVSAETAILIREGVTVAHNGQQVALVEGRENWRARGQSEFERTTNNSDKYAEAAALFANPDTAYIWNTTQEMPDHSGAQLPPRKNRLRKETAQPHELRPDSKRRGTSSGAESDYAEDAEVKALFIDGGAVGAGLIAAGNMPETIPGTSVDTPSAILLTSLFRWALSQAALRRNIFARKLADEILEDVQVKPQTLNLFVDRIVDLGREYSVQAKSLADAVYAEGQFLANLEFIHDAAGRLPDGANTSFLKAALLNWAAGRADIQSTEATGVQLSGLRIDDPRTRRGRILGTMDEAARAAHAYAVVLAALELHAEVEASNLSPAMKHWANGFILVTCIAAVGKHGGAVSAEMIGHYLGRIRGNQNFNPWYIWMNPLSKATSEVNQVGNAFLRGGQILLPDNAEPLADTIYVGLSLISILDQMDALRREIRRTFLLRGVNKPPRMERFARRSNRIWASKLVFATLEQNNRVKEALKWIQDVSNWKQH